LARSLGVELSGGGYIKGDTDQRTSEPFVYAAGDCTRLFAHQIVTAAHEGATAAQTLNYDLFKADELQGDTGRRTADRSPESVMCSQEPSSRPGPTRQEQ
jgi:pyruvate/2-oxoglutarate dehydrogenase complex dihydrolipoamide dehydrogenase (E3) component